MKSLEPKLHEQFCTGRLEARCAGQGPYQCQVLDDQEQSKAQEVPDSVPC